jgi:hypothetical protein
MSSLWAQTRYIVGRTGGCTGWVRLGGPLYRMPGLRGWGYGISTATRRRRAAREDTDAVTGITTFKGRLNTV